MPVALIRGGRKMNYNKQFGNPIEEQKEPSLEMTMETETPEVMIVTTLLNLRSTPSTDSDENILQVLTEGTQLNILDEPLEDGWTSVSTEDGVEGFVMTEFLKEE